MARGFNIGGGVETCGGDATALDILLGKTAYVQGNLVTGEIPTKAATTVTPSANSQTVTPAGTYMSGNITVNAIPNQKAATTITPTASQQTAAAAGTYTTGLLKLAAIPNQKGATTITPSASAQTAANAGTYMTGALTLGAIPNQKGATTITPTTSAQTAANAGTYMTGALTCGAIPNQQAGGAKYATTSAQTAVAASKYVTSAVTLGALSQSNLAAAYIRRGKTITISNGSANVWSVGGSTNILKMVSSGVTSSSSQRAFYKNDNDSENMYISTINPGITPVCAFWYGYDGYTIGFRNGATTWNVLNFKDNQGKWNVYVTTSKNSSWRFTSSAVDVPACYSGKWQGIYVFGY